MVADTVSPIAPMARRGESDLDLERTARFALRGRHERTVLGLDVTASGGVITLRGQMRSYYERQMLLHAVGKAVRCAEGLVGIVDDLTVANSATV